MKIAVLKRLHTEVIGEQRRGRDRGLGEMLSSAALLLQILNTQQDRYASVKTIK